MNSQILTRIKQDCEEAAGKNLSWLSSLKGECLLITGGTGFMGTWLAEIITFLNDNHSFGTKLILLSQNAYNFSAKASHLATRNDIVLIEKDVRNLIELPEEVTYLIHAAANPDSRQHSSDPLRVTEVITKGTENVLAAANRLPNLKKFANISSGLIYGPQPLELEKIPESYHGGPDCDSIVSVYPEAKRFAETLCVVYRSQFKLPTIVIRPFAFIGPYQLLDKPWAVNNFIRDSLMGGPIRILGDEGTVRSYLYGSDMAIWILKMLIDGQPGLAYNVGSPHGLSLKQLAEKIAANFPVPPKIISVTPISSNARRSRFVPDIRLAQETFGLVQNVDIDEAIRRTLYWYKTIGA